MKDEKEVKIVFNLTILCVWLTSQGYELLIPTVKNTLNELFLEGKAKVFLVVYT